MVKKILVACAVPLLAAAGLVATEGSALAIKRVNCTSYNYTWVLSNQTTCWANAGSIAVTLYSVNGVNSGNNIGWLASSSGYAYFPAKYTHYDYSSRTVDVVHID
jgi:beta/gamma crystallin